MQSSSGFGTNQLTIQIASTVADAQSITVDSRIYESASQNLRDSRSKAQSRLNQSINNQRRAAEQIESIKARLEREIRAIQEQNEVQLNENQARIDQEIVRMSELLKSEINLEADREKNLNRLVESLQRNIGDKQANIARDEGIVQEIMGVKSKVDAGKVAENLKSTVDLKLNVIAIDKKLVTDLNECLVDLQTLLKGARDRAAFTQKALGGLGRPPQTRSSDAFDWSLIEQMEQVLQKSGNDVVNEKERIREIGRRIGDTLVNRTIILGEDVPPELSKTVRQKPKKGGFSFGGTEKKNVGENKITAGGMKPSFPKGPSTPKFTPNREMGGIADRGRENTKVGGFFGKEKEKSTSDPFGKDEDEDEDEGNFFSKFAKSVSEAIENAIGGSDEDRSGLVKPLGGPPGGPPGGGFKSSSQGPNGGSGKMAGRPGTGRPGFGGNNQNGPARGNSPFGGNNQNGSAGGNSRFGGNNPNGDFGGNRQNDQRQGSSSFSDTTQTNERKGSDFFNNINK